MQKTLVVIAGPTAIGKTDLTIELARHFETEIISADSRQIYKELNIGTAVPAIGQLNQVKHHFIHHRSIHQPYNASMYEREVLSKLENIFRDYDVIFMTGGSGMYIEAVCSGIDAMPDIKPKIRELVKERLKNEGLYTLQKELLNIDPDYYYNTDTKNPVRIQRGIEMYLQTGQPFSAFRNRKNQQRSFKIVRIALDMDREMLHNRINKRVDVMMDAGLLDEVKSVYSYKGLVSLNTVGYSELFRYLDGDVNLEEAVGLIKRNTRRYARKQFSWFRRNNETIWFNPENKQQIIEYIQNQLNNTII